MCHSMCISLSNLSSVHTLPFAVQYGLLTTQPYKLVCGNTSVGVFKHDAVSVYIDVSQLAELRTVTMVPARQLIVGSAVTISELIANLLQNV